MSVEIIIDDSPEERLQKYFAAMPDWAKDAYFTNGTFHHIVKDSAQRNLAPMAMLWRLASKFYELSNAWQDTAIDNAEKYGSLVRIAPTKPRHEHSPTTSPQKPEIERD